MKRVRDAKNFVWIVTFTTYVDDYKLRGQDPSTLQGPFVYDSKEKAHQKLYQLMRNKLYGLDVPAKSMDDERVMSICCGNDEEYPDICKGEFVPMRFDWTCSRYEVL